MPIAYYLTIHSKKQVDEVMRLADTALKNLIKLGRIEAISPVLRQNPRADFTYVAQFVSGKNEVLLTMFPRKTGKPVSISCPLNAPGDRLAFTFDRLTGHVFVNPGSSCEPTERHAITETQADEWRMRAPRYASATARAAPARAAEGPVHDDSVMSDNNSALTGPSTITVMKLADSSVALPSPGDTVVHEDNTMSDDISAHITAPTTASPSVDATLSLTSSSTHAGAGASYTTVSVPTTASSPAATRDAGSDMVDAESVPAPRAPLPTVAAPAPIATTPASDDDLLLAAEWTEEIAFLQTTYDEPPQPSEEPPPAPKRAWFSRLRSALWNLSRALSK